MIRKLNAILLITMAPALSMGQNLEQMTVFGKSNDLRPLKQIKGDEDFGSLREIRSNWINYASAYKEFYGSELVGYIGPYLYPDSTVVHNYFSSGARPVDYYHVAQTYDLRSELFRDQWDGNYVYQPNYDIQIDSIKVVTRYHRVNDSVVDTLVVRYVPASTSQYSFGVNWPSFPGDTLSFIPIKYDQAKNLPVGYTLEKKIILDSAFFAGGTGSGQERTNIVNEKLGWTSPGANNGVFSIVLTFVPGDTTVKPGDTLGKHINALQVDMIGLEKDAQTFANYIKRDFNANQFVQKDARYNLAGSFNGIFTPHWAYINPHGFESTQMSLKLSQDDVVLGMAEGAKVEVSSIYPNPASESANVNFVLAEPSKVQMVITDISGKVVQNLSFGMFETGSQVIEVNTESLSDGFYNCVISAQGQSVTKRLVVSK